MWLFYELVLKKKKKKNSLYMNSRFASWVSWGAGVMYVNVTN